MNWDFKIGGGVDPSSSESSSTARVTDQGTISSGSEDAPSSSPSTEGAPSIWEKLKVLLPMSVAAIIRHFATPSLWLAFLPGRYVAFFAERVRQESGYSSTAKNPASSATGYLQFTDTNASTYGIDRSSAWSCGWATPAYFADAASTFGAWARLLIPGWAYLDAAWLGHSALEGGSLLDSCLASAEAEKTPSGFKWSKSAVYWSVRVALFLAIDVWMLFGIIYAVMWMFRRFIRRTARQVVS